MARLYALAALGLALIVAGAVLVAPDVANEQRGAVLLGIMGGLLILARMDRRRD